MSSWSTPILISTAPRIYVIDGFASAAEVAAIFADAAPHLEPSLTQSADGSLQRAAFGRRSQQFTLPPRLWSSQAASVVERMDAATLQPHGHGEHLTVTEYGVGDRYEVHVDSSLAVGRSVTALLFLEAPAEGGELIFPWAVGRAPSAQADAVPRPLPPLPPGINGTGRGLADYFDLETLPRLDEPNMCDAPSDALRIEPRAGRLVIFFNHDPQGRQLRPRSLHGSCPVYNVHVYIYTHDVYIYDIFIYAICIYICVCVCLCVCVCVCVCDYMCVYTHTLMNHWKPPLSD